MVLKSGPESQAGPKTGCTGRGSRLRRPCLPSRAQEETGLISFSPHVHRFSQKERTEREMPSPRRSLGGREERVGTSLSHPTAPPFLDRAQVPRPCCCWPYVAEGVCPVSWGVDVARCRRPVAFSSGSIGDDGGLSRVAGAHPDRWKTGTAG